MFSAETVPEILCGNSYQSVITSGLRGSWPVAGRLAGQQLMGVDYDELRARIAALTRDETDAVSLMATLACEIHHADDRFDWTGFYRVTAPGILKIGPYQGGHGCLVIPFERGVCGAAARTGEVQLVDEVTAFPGHIACAASTRSELVLPVRDRSGSLIGVLDIDSDQPAAFDESDAAGLALILAETFARAP